MKNPEQQAIPVPESAEAALMPSEDEQYRQHVASLFTAPILPADTLLENLAKYWPADAHENLLGLVAAGYIERTPTGRYRLPLPAWAAPTPEAEPATAGVPAVVVLPPPTAPAPARPSETPQPPAPAVLPQRPVAPQLRPLRLAITPVLASPRS